MTDTPSKDITSPDFAGSILSPIDARGTPSLDSPNDVVSLTNADPNFELKVLYQYIIYELYTSAIPSVRCLEIRNAVKQVFQPQNYESNGEQWQNINKFDQLICNIFKGIDESTKLPEALQIQAQVCASRALVKFLRAKTFSQGKTRRNYKLVSDLLKYTVLDADFWICAVLDAMNAVDKQTTLGNVLFRLYARSDKAQILRMYDIISIAMQREKENFRTICNQLEKSLKMFGFQYYQPQIGENVVDVEKSAEETFEDEFNTCLDDIKQFEASQGSAPREGTTVKIQSSLDEPVTPDEGTTVPNSADFAKTQRLLAVEEKETIGQVCQAWQLQLQEEIEKQKQHLNETYADAYTLIRKTKTETTAKIPQQQNITSMYEFAYFAVYGVRLLEERAVEERYVQSTFNPLSYSGAAKSYKMNWGTRFRTDFNAKAILEDCQNQHQLFPQYGFLILEPQVNETLRNLEDDGQNTKFQMQFSEQFVFDDDISPDDTSVKKAKKIAEFLLRWVNLTAVLAMTRMWRDILDQNPGDPGEKTLEVDWKQLNDAFNDSVEPVERYASRVEIDFWELAKLYRYSAYARSGRHNGKKIPTDTSEEFIKLIVREGELPYNANASNERRSWLTSEQLWEAINHLIDHPLNDESFKSQFISFMMSRSSDLSVTPSSIETSQSGSESNQTSDLIPSSALTSPTALDVSEERQDWFGSNLASPTTPESKVSASGPMKTTTTLELGENTTLSDEDWSD